MSRGHSEVFLPIWHNHAGECSSLDRSQDWQLSGSQPYQDLAANCVTESEGIPSAIPHLLTSIINSWNTVIRVVSRSGSRVKSKSSGCSGNQSGNKREKKGKKKKRIWSKHIDNTEERTYGNVIYNWNFSVTDLETVIPTPAIILRNISTNVWKYMTMHADMVIIFSFVQCPKQHKRDSRLLEMGGKKNHNHKTLWGHECKNEPF